jgi:hypothetical protein
MNGATRRILWGFAALLLVPPAAQHAAAQHAAAPLGWPPITRETKPWAYNWWPGSAVNTANLTKELTRYRDAGLGGIHIVPIYGAKGSEDKYIDYLSPRWMEMLRHTVVEADRLGLGVDMTTGSGWCFGGPNVSEYDANIATKDGYTTKPTARVKRSAPGGAGWMLNPFYADAMRHYLQRFTDTFANYSGPKPRAMYHDSYEYNCNWSPDLLAEFEKRRGYKLQTEFPALFGKKENDHVARVKSDYRETISDLMIERVWPIWNQWSRDHGFITRDQAHGSPANLLDLYALADIPETEMFHNDRSKFIAKFASSAAHVANRRLTASETGTWLNEHFTETLAELKTLVDDMFLSGVNHIFYHGCCYSPDEAAWPGWLFYAATEMNPRNAIWRDATALNAYIARCQSVLQAGQPDNDVLLYWPIYDLWHNARGLQQNLTVHDRAWFEEQPLGKTARMLWNRGYTFDYLSDRQLAGLTTCRYKAIVVPPTTHMPVETMRALLRFAEQGRTVIFEDKLPADVPGIANLEARRGELKSLAAKAGRFLVGDVEKLLERSGIERESMVDNPGLQFIRRTADTGHYYFITNQGNQLVDTFVPLAAKFAAVALLDPMTGCAGMGHCKTGTIRLQLVPGQSIILRTFNTETTNDPWTYDEPGEPIQVKGPWQVKFVQGGPKLPPSFQTEKLASWTTQGGEAERFAGTAVYSTTFDAPAGKGSWMLDLGKVWHSARVRINGNDRGTLIMSPYRVRVAQLKRAGNLLEVEVTNLSANRIRDLDRRKVEWKIFHDINFVNIAYKPFDASAWPLRPSGLLGPVTIQANERTVIP